MTNDKIGLKIQMIARLPHTTHNTTRSQIRGERSYKEKTVVMMGTRAQGTLGEHSTGDNCHVSRESDFNMQIHGPCSSHRMAIGDMDTWKFRAVNVEGGLLWSGGHLIEAH